MNFMTYLKGCKLMRIEQINSKLTRIEFSVSVNSEFNLYNTIRDYKKFIILEVGKGKCIATYKGSFEETRQVIELINRINIYEQELSRLLTTHT